MIIFVMKILEDNNFEIIETSDPLNDLQHPMSFTEEHLEDITHE